ncbi:MAG: nitroreductase family protein [Lachnospiraceae bacterium]|nr:nitroreductase family protein [Lachnospiraceae bacterium]
MEFSDDQYASIQNSIRLSRRGDYAFDYHAPILIVVANRKEYPNTVADSACALQNMMLEAESLGVGSCRINQLQWLDENQSIRFISILISPSIVPAFSSLHPEIPAVPGAYLRRCLPDISILCFESQRSEM